MTNISDLNLMRLKSIVDGEITGYYPNDGETLTVLVKENDKETQIIVNKQNIADGFKVARATITVDKTTTYSELYQLFSDKYGFGWVEDVDYNKNDKVIAVVNNGSTTITLSVSTNSILYKGSVAVIVYYNNITEQVGDTVASFNNACKLFAQQALISINSPIKVDAPIFTGNQLTAEAIDAVNERYGNLGWFVDGELESIFAGRIFHYTIYGEVIRINLRSSQNNVFSQAFVMYDETDKPTVK